MRILELSDFEFNNVATWTRQKCSVFKNEGNRMPPVNIFDDYSPLADCTESISQLNRIACLFVVIFL